MALDFDELQHLAERSRLFCDTVKVLNISDKAKRQRVCDKIQEILSMINVVIKVDCVEKTIDSLINVLNFLSKLISSKDLENSLEKIRENNLSKLSPTLRHRDGFKSFESMLNPDLETKELVKDERVALDVFVLTIIENVNILTNGFRLTPQNNGDWKEKQERRDLEINKTAKKLELDFLVLKSLIDLRSNASKLKDLIESQSNK